MPPLRRGLGDTWKCRKRQEANLTGSVSQTDSVSKTESVWEGVQKVAPYVTPASFRPGSRVVVIALDSGQKHAGMTIRGLCEMHWIGPQLGFLDTP